MSARGMLAERLQRLRAPAPAVLVVGPEVLCAARSPSRAGAPLFGTRERCGDRAIFRVTSLDPAEPLVRIGMVAGGAEDVDAGDVLLTPTDPIQATIGGAPVQVVINDPSRYRDRIAALPGALGLADKTVVLVGLGSVGSELGARLVRLGVRVIGCDPDLLVVENLVRWGLLARLDRDIGRPKCHVWAELLRATVLDAKVEGHAIDVVRQGTAFDALVSRARPDLIIAATDTRDSRRVVNAAAALHGVPALFVALSDGASSVRVEIVDDARRGPCHQCAVLGESSLDAGAAAGAGSMMPYAADAAPADAIAVPAMPVDVALGAAVAARLVLAKLAGQSLDGFLRRGEQTGNVLFFSLRPDYWIFEEAWDRLVYRVERSPDCPACGPGEDVDGR